MEMPSPLYASGFNDPSDFANDPAANRHAHADSNGEELRQAAALGNHRRHDEGQHQGNDELSNNNVRLRRIKPNHEHLA